VLHGLDAVLAAETDPAGGPADSIEGRPDRPACSKDGGCSPSVRLKKIPVSGGAGRSVICWSRPVWSPIPRAGPPPDRALARAVHRMLSAFEAPHALLEFPELPDHLREAPAGRLGAPLRHARQAGWPATTLPAGRSYWTPVSPITTVSSPISMWPLIPTHPAIKTRLPIRALPAINTAAAMATSSPICTLCAIWMILSSLARGRSGSPQHARSTVTFARSPRRRR